MSVNSIVHQAPAPGSSALKGSRVYLASRFARRNELAQLKNELNEAGATVTSTWLDSEGPLTERELTSTGRAAAAAQRDLADIADADVFIAFTEPRSSSQGRGGRHTELGVALALGKRVVIVGPREHIFHCLDSIECFPSWAHARTELLGGAQHPERHRGNSQAARFALAGRCAECGSASAFSL